MSNQNYKFYFYLRILNISLVNVNCGSSLLLVFMERHWLGHISLKNDSIANLRSVAYLNLVLWLQLGPLKPWREKGRHA